MQTVRTAPLIGLIAEVALLAALAHTVGLSVTGWCVGILCALTTNVILTRALARSRASAFGPADWVTLARSTFVAGIAALIAEALVQAASASAIVAAHSHRAGPRLGRRLGRSAHRLGDRRRCPL